MTPKREAIHNRGSAYIFVLVMTMSILLMLTIVATTSVYEAQVSRAYQAHANLSLLAHTGVERAVRDMNAELYACRAQIMAAARARLSGGGELMALYMEEAERLMRERFADSEIVYDLTLPAEGTSQPAVYTVTVRITANGGGGFALSAAAARAGLATGEQVQATVTCAANATAETLIETVDGHSVTVVKGEIAYRIEKLKQNR